METEGHLEKIQAQLLTHELEMERSSPNEKIPFEHLLLTLSSDTNETEYYTLIVSVIEGQLLAANFDSGGKSDLIQILHPFPYQAIKEKVPELLRCVNLLNKVLVLGAFGYDEEENRCFFRYSHSLSRSRPDYEEAAQVILLVHDILNTYTTAIENISTGVATLEELLAQFQPPGEEE